jgi:hypothetical protein
VTLSGNLKANDVILAGADCAEEFDVAGVGLEPGTVAVYCKVDASQGRVEVGDLLTSSDLPGHAMRASDPARALGAIIGKALRPLASGQALLPILVALQ